MKFFHIIIYIKNSSIISFLSLDYFLASVQTHFIYWCFMNNKNFCFLRLYEFQMVQLVVANQIRHFSCLYPLICKGISLIAYNKLHSKLFIIFNFMYLKISQQPFLYLLQVSNIYHLVSSFVNKNPLNYSLQRDATF